MHLLADVEVNPAMPPRPSVVAIRRKGGGKIAT
jgi:secreted PhoX family phosphatase